MKLISPFKDYYDHLVGQYGIDEKVVYERIPETKDGTGWWNKEGMYVPLYKKNPNIWEDWQVAFCGRVYYIYYLFGDWYIGDLYDEKMRKPKIDISKYPQLEQRSLMQTSWNEWKKSFSGRIYDRHGKYGERTDINDQLMCPVIVDNKYKNPCLKDLGFSKIMEPQGAYLELNSWLSREKFIPNRQSDKEKILSHGFDLKTSFRKTK